MELRKLGTSDLNVSKICLGTMTFGQQNTEAEAHEQMDYAVANGVNFFDAAELYAVPSRPENNGKTEQFIGTWFKKSQKRSKIVMATKIAGPNPGLKHIRNGNLNFQAQTIREALEGNLKRLQTDYIDIYQLHWPERKTNMFGKLGFEWDENDAWQDNFLEILQTMDALIKEGTIRHWGVSNETAWGLMHFLHLAEKHNLPKPLTIQNPYSLLNRSYEVGLAEVSMREKVGLLAYSPMGFGLLSGKYHKKLDTPDNRINQFKNLSRYNSKESWDATAAYIDLAESNGLTITQLALAFVNSRPFMASTIIGATTMEQLKENIQTASVTLSDEILKAIEAIHKTYPNPAP